MWGGKRRMGRPVPRTHGQLVSELGISIPLWFSEAKKGDRALTTWQERFLLRFPSLSRKKLLRGGGCLMPQFLK